MNPSQKWVPLGKVLQEWGVRGQVKCISFNPDSTLLAEAETLYLQTAEGYRSFIVESVQPHDRYWRIKFAGLGSPEAARLYRGAMIALPREELPPLAKGEIYLEDLLGFKVTGPAGEDLGMVLAWETIGSSEACLIGEEIKTAKLIPYRGEFVEKTDKAERKIFLTSLAMDLLRL
jgi:16S rRNA processing protein RimM